MNAAAGHPAGFPWDDVLAIGLGLLRLSPREFWSMTTREFAAMTNGLTRRGTEPPDRDALARLMRAYPDDNRRQQSR